MLPNGVDRPEASPQSMQSLPWSPSMTRPGGGYGAIEQAAEQRPEPPRLPVESSAGSGLDVRTPLGAHSGGLGSPSATAEWPPALRWMGRLNEFLQRATGPVETFTALTRQQLSGSREGLVVQQEHTYRRHTASPLHATDARQQQAAAATSTVAPGWATQAPLLHGSPSMAQQEGSDRASSTSIPREMVQEEVRRQVMEAMRMQTAQMEELRRENELLRAGQALEGEQNGPRGDRVLVMQADVPQGDRALGLQLTVPKGDRASLVQQSVPQGDRALGAQQSVSPGDRAFSMQPSVPQGDRALDVQYSVPPGDRALGAQHSVPPGDRALGEQQSVPPGDGACFEQQTEREICKRGR